MGLTLTFDKSNFGVTVKIKNNKIMNSVDISQGNGLNYCWFDIIRLNTTFCEATSGKQTKVLIYRVLF